MQRFPVAAPLLGNGVSSGGPVTGAAALGLLGQRQTAKRTHANEPAAVFADSGKLRELEYRADKSIARLALNCPSMAARSDAWVGVC
jgi:hypothetical protein